MKRALSIAALTLVFLFAGCASNGGNEKAILGKWQQDDIPGSTMEFFDSGDVSCTAGDGTSAAAHYSFVDDNHVKIEGLLGSTFIAEVAIDGDSMTAKNNLGKTETWTRVKS